MRLRGIIIGSAGSDLFKPFLDNFLELIGRVWAELIRFDTRMGQDGSKRLVDGTGGDTLFISVIIAQSIYRAISIDFN